MTEWHYLRRDRVIRLLRFFFSFWPGSGLLKIAEVASRFSSVAAFVQGVESHGFRLKSKDTSDSFFFFFDFDKMADAVDPRARRPVVLQPCIYKKR